MPSEFEPSNIVVEEPFVVGISTCALFHSEAKHSFLASRDGETRAIRRRPNASASLPPGAGFPLIQRMLQLRTHNGERLVEVVLISGSAPDCALRAYQSCASHGLAIAAGSFTSGRPVAPYVAAWDVDLFLSSEADDVCQASAMGSAAARLGPRAALDAARTGHRSQCARP
jgi:5'-nucleotidase